MVNLNDAEQSRFYDVSTPIDAGAARAFDITPHNTEDLAFVTRGIYVGGSGSLKVDMAGGGTVTYLNVAAGVTHPWRVSRVYATGTDATGIIGQY